ncbi:Uncharacterized protein APZ42_026277 [Daphnia magna]|uniref:Uncharacterized protein n=1 Tax=Daphnia magna TaxID=35525 RepID=A0A164SBC0_9CRUS|nr:Uncharacterized protein APZ42_026277 [Daphnia magna]
MSLVNRKMDCKLLQSKFIRNPLSRTVLSIITTAVTIISNKQQITIRIQKPAT